jgi:hypothetical protein
VSHRHPTLDDIFKATYLRPPPLSYHDIIMLNVLKMFYFGRKRKKHECDIAQEAHINIGVSGLLALFFH